MTPQLQQAIRLLQLSSLELNGEIQEALDSNMMLEVVEDGDTGASSDDSQINGHQRGNDERDGQAISNELSPEAEVRATADDMPGDLPVDSDWDELYDGLNSYQPTGIASEGGAKEFDNFHSATGSLREHLLWQINLMPLSDTDRAIAFALIDGLNSDGYLEGNIEEVHALLVNGEALDIDLDEVEAVLKQIQGLDPVGVGARDLRECLLLQLRQLGETTDWLNEAKQICNEYLEALGTHNYAQIMRRMKLSEEDLHQVINLIQSMNPRPGAPYNEDPPEYVVPDVFVRKDNGRWKVELNIDTIPHLRINPFYAGMIKRADKSAENGSLKSHLQEARWFIKSLQSRSETLLRVATAIVERQRAFFDHGEEAMKPLVLHDIADVLGMHESTISRVTTRKYMHTPRGIYELKYFFSSHVGTTIGSEVSSTAIRAIIKKLIAAEHAPKPLSDSKIAELLCDQGIKVARRTVAKYREAMSIPPSNERKRLM